MELTVSRISGYGGVTGRLRALGKEIIDGLTPNLKSFVLLDFPHHDNVGDSAIWLGEIDYFRRRNLRARYVSSHHDVSWEKVDRFGQGGPIFMHGGGNFGDLWPEFQNFREQVLERYAGQPIIQLPQTIHFGDSDRIAATARAIAKHGAFTLLVRDQPSYDFASKHFDCRTILCPDMAFHIERFSGVVRPTHEVLYHLRQDKESALDAKLVSTLPSQAYKADWPLDPTRIENHVMPKTLLRLAFSGQGLPPPRSVAREELYRQLASYRLAQGMRLLSSAQRVVTDRLHGHILCTMLGKSHEVIDNSYGKIGGFISAWGTDSGGSLTGYKSPAEATL